MPNIEPTLALLKKPIEVAYELSKGVLKQKIQRLRAENRIKNLYSKLSATQKVKTIWNTDRALSLASMFYPVSVQLSRVQSQRINSLDDFPENHVLIAGTGGQGKSLLVRYLLGKEIRSGSRIPLLFELRHLENDLLVSRLAASLDDLLEMKSSGELFTHFAENGKVSILLDGFDEIDPSKISAVGHQIQQLAERFPNSRLLITSRPESGVEFLRTFVVRQIQPLSLDDLPHFYDRITRDKAFTNRLVAAISVSPVEIKDLVKTPLLATLLAMSYKSSERIPPDFVEFYEQLFQVLFVRHDASKTGFLRTRKSKITDREIQLAFEAFCFKTRKSAQSALGWDRAVEFANESLSAIGLKAEPADVLADVQKISCLLMRDGNKLEFAHKSVQEYFAARFIRSRPDAVAERIYSAMLPEAKWGYWSGELTFLRQIDKFRALKYFVVPDLQETLNLLDSGASKLQPRDVANFLGDSLTVSKQVHKDRASVPEVRYFVEKAHGIQTQHMQEIEQRLFSRLFRHQEPNRPTWSSGFGSALQPEKRTYLTIADDIGIRDEILRVVKVTVEDLRNRLSGYKDYLAKESESSEFTAI